MGTINLRSLRNIQSVIPICEELRDSIEDKDLGIDFCNLTFVTPFAAAFFSRELKYIVTERKSKGLQTYIRGHKTDCEVLSYLKFIGFFDLLGLEGFGEKMRSMISPHATYIPITKYTYKRFEPDLEINQLGQPVDLIEPEAREISRLFTKNSTPHKTIQYIICEILRNAYEHSQSDFFYVFGQYWSSGAMELAILDNGIGILSTLARKYPKLDNQEDAIKKSLEAGVSCADFDIEKNKYCNSGFGLYVISELAKKHGHLLIASKEKALSFRSDSISTYNTFPAGTLICIRIDDIWTRDYEKEIDEIIATGQVIASQAEFPISPSKQTLSYKDKK